MIATLSGETLEVVRHRRGVLWCPFCDASMQEGYSPYCPNCNAEFRDENPDDVVGVLTLDPDNMPDTVMVGGTEVPVIGVPEEPQSEREACARCGQMVSTRPVAQASHWKKHEREAAR